MLPQWKISSRRVWFVAILVILCIVIVAGIVRAATRPSAQPHSAPSTQPTRVVLPSHSTTPPQSDPEVPQAGAHATSIGAPTLDTLAKRAGAVVRLYASFPAQKGTDSLLAQLKPLVTTAALADIRKQWQGPTGGVYAQATGKVIVIKTDAVSADTVKVYTYISQSISASDAPKDFHIFGAIVTFTETGAKWHVTRVSNDSQDYS